MARKKREKPVETATEQPTEQPIRTAQKIKVRAIGREIGAVVGFSKEGARIKAGEVFYVEPHMFSERWMVKVPEDAVSVVKEETGRKEVAFSKMKPDIEGGYRS